MSSVFADRMLYADYVAEDIVKTDPGNRGIENERIYMYISHFIDRKGGPYDPINNPLDDPHLAKYIVRNDRDNYDLFLSKANGLESVKQFIDVYNAASGIKDGVLALKDSVSSMLPDDKTISSFIEVFNSNLAGYSKIKKDVEDITGLEDNFKLFNESFKNAVRILPVVGKGMHSEDILKEFEDTMKGDDFDNMVEGSVFGNFVSLLELLDGTANSLSAITVNPEDIDNLVSKSINLLYETCRDLILINIYGYLTILEHTNWLVLVQTLSMRMGYRYYKWLYDEDWS